MRKRFKVSKALVHGHILPQTVHCVFPTFVHRVYRSGKADTARPVSPVVSGGVQYSADGNGQDQYVVATDTTSGKVLWKVKVFHTRIKPWVEEDNQWVFITDLKLVGNSLHVRDERSRCYLIDLTTRHARGSNVTPVPDSVDGCLQSSQSSYLRERYLPASTSSATFVLQRFRHPTSGFLLQTFSALSRHGSSLDRS